MKTGSFLLLAAMALGAGLSCAQEPIKFGDVIFQGSDRTRLETWDFFDPGGGAQNQYTFPGSIIRLSLRETKPAFEWQLEFAAPVLLSLPTNAIAAGAPGQLGMGASYYAANNKNQNAAMVFARQGYFRWKRSKGESKQWLEIGRFDFSDGAEVAPADPTLAALKRDRIAQRLLGNFGYTDVGRSFDGAQYSMTKGNVNVTLMAARPTRGVFQADGWGEINKVNVFYGALTAGFPGKAAGELRVFAIGYLDDRDGVLKTDNRTAALRKADTGHIAIGTYGAHYLRNIPTAAGSFDGLLWGVVQNGSWGSLTQRSYAWAAEGGWQPKALPRMAPWLRGGVDYGSGDGNANDQTHGAFFQILPTPRPYARLPFFNMMNMCDAFGELILRPNKRLTLRSDIHSLKLANANDLWYSGGGVYQPWTFGYTGRAPNGHGGLATMFDISADFAVNQHVSLGAYLGHAAGKLVIQSIFPADSNANFGFAEFGYKF